LSGEVLANDLINIEIQSERVRLQGSLFGGTTNVDASFTQALKNRGYVDAEPFGDGDRCLSSGIGLDNVIQVESHAFSGHVYNLQTNAGQYIANGIVTHNCADLISWAMMDNGLETVYGTEAFEDFLVDIQDFDPSAPGVPGAIAYDPYISAAVGSQGHIACYVNDAVIIQALAGTPPYYGVTDEFTDAETYSWGGDTLFTRYGFLPGVDYSSTSTTPIVIPPKWIAINHEGMLVANGKDYSGGWYDTGWSKGDWSFHGS
jgi:hypothetical protein